MTRPRMAGSTLSWTIEFAVVNTVSAVSPTGMSRTANQMYEGASAAAAEATANAAKDTRRMRRRGFGRRAESSAADKDPTAMMEPSSPYAPAPLWNTAVAMSAVVIWKFIPKVPCLLYTSDAADDLLCVDLGG